MSRRPTSTTIDALATFLGVPKSKTAKAAFFVTGDDRFVVAIVRGDYDVNETKLVNLVKARKGLRPATVEEIKARGMEAGYGSPLGARDAIVVVDELVARSPNLVAGANRLGWHVRNVNVPRDYTPDHVAEITNAREGDPCPNCGSPVKLRKGIEVGNIFKLGTEFTDAFGAMYLGEDGVRHPIVMGSYGIGLGRNVACIVEAHHDDKGIVWPAEVAPYAAHLVSIGGGQGAARRRDRRAAPRSRGRRRPAPRDPVGRPRRVARREVHRRRAPGHALDPDGLAALARGGRRRGHGAGDRRSLDPLDRGRRGDADRAPLSLAQDLARGDLGSSAAPLATSCARLMKLTVPSSRGPGAWLRPAPGGA